MRFVTWIVVLFAVSPVFGGEDALEEVNAARQSRGLPPFIKDEGLTNGAINVADFRASNLIAGHTSNDFNGLPSGCSANASGCAAWHPSMGWGACCTYESWRYAGAAWSLGRDGRRYMHLFVSTSPSAKSTDGTVTQPTPPVEEVTTSNYQPTESRRRFRRRG